MSKTKAASKKSHLPSKPPKRTGKAGIRPLDPEEAPVAEREPEPPDTRDEELLETPGQGRLPTMEDAEIEEIEQAARKYVKLRDSRQRILREEVEQKGLLLQILHRHGKETYVYDDLEIEIVKTAEKVRVKIKKDDGE